VTMPAQDTTERMLTQSELAYRWKCAPGSLANARSKGTGPAYLKIGASVRYLLVDIEAYEQAVRVAQDAA
jgi:hypothetical protein